MHTRLYCRGEVHSLSWCCYNFRASGKEGPCCLSSHFSIFDILGFAQSITIESMIGKQLHTMGKSSGLLSARFLCTTTTRPPLKPISAFVNKNVENLERKENFVPGHQHHQHGMTGTGGGGHSAPKQGGYLLNGSRTVNEQRPSPSKPKDVTVMAQRDSRR